MKNLSLHSPISRLLMMCMCFFCLCLAISAILVAACTCPNTTSGTPALQPDGTTCIVQPQVPCTIMPGNTYLLRKTIPGVQGAMTFIGNTLGLSKKLCENNPGTSATDNTDAIGAFITTNSSNVVNNYVSATTGPGSPGGTTLNWRENNSTAVLALPAGSTVLYAELIWGGSAGFYCQDAKVGVDPNCILQYTTPMNGAVNFTTPDGVTHAVSPDITTSLISIDPATNPAQNLCGVYIYTQSRRDSFSFNSSHSQWHLCLRRCSCNCVPS